MKAIGGRPKGAPHLQQVEDVGELAAPHLGQMRE
jgi:hypothetical protein